MKKIAVVATEKEYAEFLKRNIEKYMGRYAEFVTYSIKQLEGKAVLEEDFVLLSAFNIFQQVKQKIEHSSEIVVLSLSLSNRQIESLKKIPAGTRALLVNFDNRSCMHTITCMYDAGIRSLELAPYHGIGSYDESIKTAITPNEAHLVPEGIEKVYDVGESSVDMSSLYNIAEKLGVYDEFSSNEANEARKEYYHLDSGMNRLMNDKESMRDKLNTLLKLMKDGIVITDSVGRIYLANEKANTLLEEKSAVLQGFNIEEVLPELDVTSTKEKLIKTAKANLIASAVEVRTNEEVVGHIVTLEDFEEAEEKQHGMRSKLSSNRHFAKYHFEDILGDSRIIQDTILSARQMANTDATVMITGESGTGKEMFAQSIHNGSGRRGYKFVAVNCSAIPGNLLESEMFGYEEGSFTGALKGGKLGLFELAHKGTIFLDEIADMSLMLQAKLLRVLEEKKMMRIGANDNIDIDVRVISSTNKDIFALVERGDFREDLYYRLNVLPLKVPALRERKDDIHTILTAFVNRMNSRMSLSSNASDVMRDYPWRGNVRELRNMAEFLISKGKQYIEEDDFFSWQIPERQEVIDKESASLVDKFVLNEGRNLDLYSAVLGVLKESYENADKHGRKILTEKIKRKGENFSEGEVRTALSKLSSYGFVRSAKGRGGSSITKEGLNLLEIIKRYERGEVWANGLKEKKVR